MERPSLLILVLCVALAWIAGTDARPNAVVREPCAPMLAGQGPLTEATSEQPSQLMPMRHASAVMLFVDFPDRRANDPPRRLYQVFAPRAQSWYRAVSYGSLTLSVSPVLRWFRLPKTVREYGLRGGVGPNEQRAFLRDAVAAADDAVDFSQYAIVYVVAARGTGVYHSPGFVVPPRDGVSADGSEVRFAATLFDDASTLGYPAATLIHETGHILGLPDLYRIPGRFPQSSRAVGDWDVMSWPLAGRHLLAWHEWKLGWLDPSQIACVDGPTTFTARLAPIEVPGGMKAIVVPLGATTAYVIEARRRRGLDAKICKQGVLVYEVDSSIPSGRLPVRIRIAQRDDVRRRDRCGQLYGAPFAPGSTFVDQRAGVEVEVVSGNPAGYTVTVRRRG